MTIYTQIGQSNPDYTSMPAAPTVATLYSMAEQIQAMLEQIAMQAGTALPDRKIIYMLPLPADCPQWGVLFSGWQLEDGGGRMVTCSTSRWLGRFSVLITRNTPAMPVKDQPPPAGQMSAAAKVASDDAELLIELLNNLGEVGDAAIETPAAEGGLQSVFLTVLLPAAGGWG